MAAAHLWNVKSFDHFHIVFRPLGQRRSSLWGTTRSKSPWCSNTNLLALEMAEHLLTMGGLRFMAGDFNFRIGTLEVFQVLEKAGFRDIQDIAEERWGQPVQVTCKGKSGKDFCFLSPELQSLLVGVVVDDTIWADHAVPKGKFRGGSSVIERHYWPIPKEMQWPSNMEFELNPERHTRADPSIKYEQLWNEVETAANQARLRDGISCQHLMRV